MLTVGALVFAVLATISVWLPLTDGSVVDVPGSAMRAQLLLAGLVAIGSAVALIALDAGGTGRRRLEAGLRIVLVAMGGVLCGSAVELAADIDLVIGGGGVLLLVSGAGVGVLAALLVGPLSGAMLSVPLVRAAAAVTGLGGVLMIAAGPATWYEFLASSSLTPVSVSGLEQHVGTIVLVLGVVLIVVAGAGAMEFGASRGLSATRPAWTPWPSASSGWGSPPWGWAWR